jgi:hypothetical protein
MTASSLYSDKSGNMCLKCTSMTEHNEHEIVSKVLNFHYFTPTYGYFVGLRSSIAVKNDRFVLLMLTTFRK